MFKRIWIMMSYEYAVESQRNFIENRLLAFVLDVMEVGVFIVLALIASKLLAMLVGVLGGI